MPLQSLELQQFSSIYPVFSTPCLYVIINGVAMDILIHPFPSKEEELYQRLAPLLNAIITDSQDSINVATPSRPSTSEQSSTEKSRQGSTAEQSSSTKDHTVQETGKETAVHASPAQTDLKKKNR